MAARRVTLGCIAAGLVACYFNTGSGPQPATPGPSACGATVEVCNARDDDCDGQVDETCPYAGGGVQVTAAWSGSADIDLSVTDPLNAKVSYADRRVASGGELNQDANAHCVASPVAVENVRWASAAPPGVYRVGLVAAEMCGASNVRVTLSISVGGRQARSEEITLRAQGEERVVTFTVP